MTKSVAVSAVVLHAVAQKLGLSQQSRKGYVKYYASPTLRGPSIQVWLSKDGAESTSIDIVNFESKHAIPHRNAGKASWYKTVPQQLDMSVGRSPKEIYNSFYLVGKDMLAFRPAAPSAVDVEKELPAELQEKPEPQAEAAPQ